MNSKKGSLSTTMLTVTLVPLFILGIVITAFSSRTFSRGMYAEVESGLKNLGTSILNTYDFVYPGDYKLIGEDTVALMKGNSIISGDNKIIDSIKENTGVDITLFYQDTRILTTICDEDGNRLIGTGAHFQIVKDVLGTQTAHFYSNVLLNDKEYFAYYAPIFNADGTCVGMIAASKPVATVESYINKSIAPLIIIALLTMAVVSFIIVQFTNNIVKIITQMKAFLGEIAKGNLTSKLDMNVTNRNDELGEMGRFTVHVQKSLRELVEQDALTKLYNRRSGEEQLIKLRKRQQKTKRPFCVAIGDIDFFKRFNDEYGHECGDIVLKEIAKLLEKDMLGKGFVCRWGGEEFLFAFEHFSICEAKQSLEETLNHIRNMKINYNGQDLIVTMSFGAVEYETGTDVFKAVNDADAKLYEGKLSGRNKVVC